MPNQESLQELLNEANKLLNIKEEPKTWAQYIGISKKSDAELTGELHSKLKILTTDRDSFTNLSKNEDDRYATAAKQHDALINKINKNTSVFINSNIEKIATSPNKSEALTALKIANQNDDLSMRQMAALSKWQSEDNTPLLYSVNAIRTLSQVTKDKTNIDQAINKLDKEAVKPAEIPSLNAQNMTDGLSGMCQYLMEVGSGIINSKNNIAVSAVDSVFKGVMSGAVKGDLSIVNILKKSSLGTSAGALNHALSENKHLNSAIGGILRTSPNFDTLSSKAKAVAGALAGAAGSLVTNYSQKFSPDAADLFIEATIGLVTTGNVTDIASNVIKERIYNGVWEVTGGKADLKKRNFIEATAKYCISKKIAEYAPQIGAAVVGQVYNYLSSESTKMNSPEEDKVFKSTLTAIALSGLAIAATYNWSGRTTPTPPSSPTTSPVNSRPSSPEITESPITITENINSPIKLDKIKIPSRPSSPTSIDRGIDSPPPKYKGEFDVNDRKISPSNTPTKTIPKTFGR